MSDFQEQIMKYLLSLLFLFPGLVLAQQPPGGQPEGSFFEHFKQTMEKTMEMSLPAMKETRSCVAKANSQADAEKCMKTMAKKVKEIQTSLGMPAGAGPNAMDMAKPPEGFKWNKESKEKLLKNIDMSITQGSDMLECLKSSKTQEGMGKCMRGKMDKMK
jgi:hypothetical protein